MKLLFVCFLMLMTGQLFSAAEYLEDGEVHQADIIVNCFESTSPKGEDLLGFRVESGKIIYSKSFDIKCLSFLNEGQIRNSLALMKLLEMQQCLVSMHP